MTMLTVVKGDRSLCKRLVGGKLLPYQKAYLYQAQVVEVQDLAGLSSVLTALEKEEFKAVLRDIPKEPGTTGRRTKDRFTLGPQPWLCLDHDGPKPEGCPDYVEEPEGALAWMIDNVWTYLRGVGLHWQLGNSAGVVPAEVKMSWHLWVWLDRPVARCSKWLESKGFDRSMTNPVQLHYTASPVGVTVKRRSGYIAGGPLVGVVEDPPATRTGVAYQAGYQCTEEDKVNITAELASLIPVNGERHAAIRKWIIRAESIEFPETQAEASRWLVEQGRDEQQAWSEVARLISWARTGLESGELEPDTALRPDLVNWGEDEEPSLGEDEAKAQAEALGCASLRDGLRQAGDKFSWLRDNLEKVAKLDPISFGEIRDTWGKGVRDLDRAVADLRQTEDSTDWAVFAQKIIDERARPLVYVQEEWYQWNGKFWELVEPVWVRKEVSDKMDAPTTSRVANAYQQLQFACARGYKGEPEGTPFQNGRLIRGSLVPHDAENGGRYCLGFDYVPGARCPTWDKVLVDWFDGDDRALLLRQWCHYLVTGRKDLHKIMLLTGQQRAGKGTIISAMQSLIGHENYSTPSMSSFASEFGLQSSLEKRAMFIADAHLPSRDRSTILDRLKGISGKDRIDVNRKNLPVVKGARLGQIVIGCNDMEDIQDESNALIDRYSVLVFTKTHLGREDLGLEGKLVAELPGIMNWALTCPAYERFIEEKRGAIKRRDMTMSSNPLRTWALETLVSDELGAVSLDELYGRFKSWAENQGQTRIKAKNAFSRGLKAVFPDADTQRAREGKDRVVMVYGVAYRDNSANEAVEEDEESF